MSTKRLFIGLIVVFCNLYGWNPVICDELTFARFLSEAPPAWQRVIDSYDSTEFKVTTESFDGPSRDQLKRTNQVDAVVMQTDCGFLIQGKMKIGNRNGGKFEEFAILRNLQYQAHIQKTDVGNFVAAMYSGRQGPSASKYCVPGLNIFGGLLTNVVVFSRDNAKSNLAIQRCLLAVDATEILTGEFTGNVMVALASCQVGDVANLSSTHYSMVLNPSRNWTLVHFKGIETGADGAILRECRNTFSRENIFCFHPEMVEEIIDRPDHVLVFQRRFEPVTEFDQNTHFSLGMFGLPEPKSHQTANSITAYRVLCFLFLAGCLCSLLFNAIYTKNPHYHTVRETPNFQHGKHLLRTIFERKS